MRQSRGTRGPGSTVVGGRARLVAAVVVAAVVLLPACSSGSGSSGSGTTTSPAQATSTTKVPAVCATENRHLATAVDAYQKAQGKPPATLQDLTDLLTVMPRNYTVADGKIVVTDEGRANGCPATPKQPESFVGRDIQAASTVACTTEYQTIQSALAVYEATNGEPAATTADLVDGGYLGTAPTYYEVQFGAVVLSDAGKQGGCPPNG